MNIIRDFNEFCTQILTERVVMFIIGPQAFFGDDYNLAVR